MAEKTGISWCDHTFNGWVGCTKVSSACDNCYAEALMDHRMHRVEWGAERSRTSAANWQQPGRWDEAARKAGVRRKVFCASLADVFDNQVPSRWREDLWFLIERTPNLDWLLLTKRPQNIAKMLPDPRTGIRPWENGWPNVWLGTTTENQKEADLRIPHLLAVPAAKHFISAEPLLGPVDLTHIPFRDGDARHKQDVLSGDALIYGEGVDGRPDIVVRTAFGKLTRLAFVIAGGESGPGARPMHRAWARSLRDQCVAAGVPFHFKQWGEWRPVADLSDGGERFERVGKHAAGRLLDGREWSEFPPERTTDAARKTAEAEA
ncbi:MAG TPA: phage Gp37/Gp68 family protein [Stellaceae bacterium]|nr:phage Gp37/Gp68 family protein [Stellaceae bacterium]